MDWGKGDLDNCNAQCYCSCILLSSAEKNYYQFKAATFVSKSHPNPTKTELLTPVYLSYLFDTTI